MSASPFSYAQAAKGRASAAAGSLSAVDAQNKDDASSVTTAPDASAKTFSTTSEVSDSVKSSQIENDIGNKKSGAKGDADSGSAPAKDDAAAQDATMTTKPDTQSANDSSARNPNRSTEPSDSRKGRKGKKGRNTEKESESEQAAAELEREKEKAKKDLANLVEGAPPAVNVWHQRAQAKAKQPSLGSGLVAAEPKPKAAPEAPTMTSSTSEADEAQRSAIKSGEASRPAADSSVRKARGNRVSERSDHSAAPPSAAEDVTSWPTPDTVASEDGKRKTAIEPDSKEKQEDGTKSSRPKPHWQKVEITPSVVFSTSVSRGPVRARAGGQAGRGASRAHSASVDERAPGAANDALASREARDEPQNGAREDVRATLPPSEKNKKPNGDHAPRKQSVASGVKGSGAGDQAAKSDTAKTPNINETVTKKEESKTHNHKSKRGVGHPNNRGAHNGQQSFMGNGNGNGNGAPRGSNHSPPSFGAPYTQQFPTPRGRGRPTGSNGFKGPVNGMGKMHSQHPQQVGSEYSQFTPVFGQPPFQPGPQQLPPYPTLKLDVLKQQVEFYFSDQNLYGDHYLKSKLDAQGFVGLAIIAEFPRMQALSEGDMDAIRAAVLAAKNIEYVVGDGVELIRRLGDWHKFVLDGSRPGPTKVLPMPEPKYTPPNTYYQPMGYTQYPPMSPPYMPPNPQDIHPGYMSRHQFPSNGAQINTHIATDNSNLNVAARVFSPVHQGPNGFYPQPNWEQPGFSNGATAASAVGEAQTLNSLGTDKPANGTAETETVNAKANGIHVDSESLTTPESGSTDGAVMYSVSATPHTADGSPLAANGDVNQAQ